jgi:hypothetical protein
VICRHPAVVVVVAAERGRLQQELQLLPLLLLLLPALQALPLGPLLAISPESTRKQQAFGCTHINTCAGCYWVAGYSKKRAWRHMV